MSETPTATSPNPNPSLSREFCAQEAKPPLIHSLHETRSSVLSLAASDDYIFSGNQYQVISVWCKKTYTLVETLRGHTGSVLDLEYIREKDWLISSSGDSTVRIWSTTKLAPLYVIVPYGDTQAGDLFSLTWSPSLETIYIGSQDTSLQWFSAADMLSHALDNQSLSGSPRTGSPDESGSQTPLRKAHKFFDSYPRYQRRPADLDARNGPHSSLDDISKSLDTSTSEHLSGDAYFYVSSQNVFDSAHYGYIYCMTAFEGNQSGVESAQGPHLVTGSGDESVKVWSLSPSGPQLFHEFSCGHGAIYGFVSKIDTGTIYAASQDGYVFVLDLETRTVVRSVLVHENVAILSLSMFGKELFTCSANGAVHRWSSSFDCTASWKGHDGIALSSIVTKSKEPKDAALLLTGGGDNNINVWAIDESSQLPSAATDKDVTWDIDGQTSESDTLIYALSKFVSIPSVSGDPKYGEDCRQAAIWLKKCLTQLGAKSSLLPTGEGRNPLVLATFHGSLGDKPKPRILFYGHYDVISAPAASQWKSPPFTLSGRNGYLYGRGVTDDKGPIMAVASAASNLLRARKLGVDLVFLIEGEEESGSLGLTEGVKKYKEQIGNIDAILVSNSTWIAEEPPCITYGLRGVVHSSLTIQSGRPDLHSGIDGGAVREPMLDMVKLLALLTDDIGRVRIPTFYDQVRRQTEDEKRLYQKLSAYVERSAEDLASRWREPSLTVHSVQIPGSGNSTVIPGSVKAQISLRLVPDQDLDTIVSLLRNFLQESFKKLRSSNQLNVDIENTADWWLGNLDDRWFKALENAVRDEWGVEPLRIREGGSIPSIPYLEKEFACHALHLPLGQSTDQAHLPNERISVNNLYRGRSVIERFLLNAARTCC